MKQSTQIRAIYLKGSLARKKQATQTDRYLQQAGSVSPTDFYREKNL